MASYGSTSGLSFSLNKRHLPRAQSEAIPLPGDESESDNEAGSLRASSLRANFMPPGLELGSVDVGDAVYGSLSQSLQSPVFSQLSRMQPERLGAASTASQELRLKLMRGSSVLIIQGGYPGKQFIYDRLRELGVSVTIMDGPNSHWCAAAEEGIIDDFIELDFTEHDTVFQRAVEAIKDALQHTHFDAVTTYFEDAVSLSARLAATLQLGVNPVEACDRARNKRRTREVMAQVGLPVPRFARVECADDIAPACVQVGFPAIMKPAFGAASLGVTRVNDLAEALAAYAKLFPTLDVKEDPIWAQGTEMVLEEYYDGDEFDIDLLLFGGKIVYAKVSDNWACWEPWFQETGTNCPSIYPAAKQRELEKLAGDTALALGFRAGCFHVECKYTSRGPRIIEVNARMGGVSVRDINRCAWGVDLVEEHCMAALRIPIRPVIPAQPLRFMAESAVNAPFSGVINAENWLDFVLEDKRVHKITYFKKKGDRVVGPEDGVPDWIVEIIVISDVSQEEAIGVIRDIVKNKAPVAIDPKVPGVKKPYFFPDHMHPFPVGGSAVAGAPPAKAAAPPAAALVTPVATRTK